MPVVRGGAPEAARGAVVSRYREDLRDDEQQERVLQAIADEHGLPDLAAAAEWRRLRAVEQLRQIREAAPESRAEFDVEGAG